MKKYIPYAIALLILAAFIAGRMSGGNNDAEKELLNQWEKEREAYHQAIGQKDAQIVRLNQAQEAINQRRVSDSIRFAGALERNQMAYNRLKKKYNEINLNRATVHQLDSVVSALYP